jgi:malto-oligosyltrehalose synthase/4-alpha-glucanotransferase
MYNPVSSYRIQFNKSFTLKDLENYHGYLKTLGVGSIYASPIFTATPGSDHGYDVTDPCSINPELGTIDDFIRLRKTLKESGIKWIQDIVPNHMAYHTENRWITDVLEKGYESDFFMIFDTEPTVALGTEKIMLPFLGTDLGLVLENHELQISLHKGNLTLGYFDNFYPASFDSFKWLFASHIDEAPDCFRLIWNRYDLGLRVADRSFLNGEWELVKKEFSGFCKDDPGMQTFLSKLLSQVNNSQGLLGEFISLQHYELCHWRETAKRINYRRFFTVNGLICLRMEDKTVLEKHHGFLKELVKADLIRGLRIDHIDGLRDPAGYLRELRGITGGEAYIIVEKILEPGEKIPWNWPVEGSSGYDFLSQLNNLMMQEKSYKKLQKFYHQITGDNTPPQDIIYKNKKLILSEHMTGEWNNLHLLFEKLFNYAERKGIASYNENRNITRDTLKEAIGEFMLSFPLYRLYPQEFPLYGEARTMADGIFSAAIKRNSDARYSLKLLRELILRDKSNDREYNRLLGEFFSRMMQFTGPLTAKGVEDTSMYQYSCFIAANEVGDSIVSHGMDAGSFHNAMAHRLSELPLSLNGTATHDTKRGEDVRARLNAIGDIPDEWISKVKEWIKINSQLKTANIPTASEEYFIYQTIAGTFPFNENPDEEYKKRIREYIVKMLREAKISSGWENPDLNHEKAVCNFSDALFDTGHGFMKSFLPFYRKLAGQGIVNSLFQLTVKCLSPGLPDIYRGTEMWDLSLVDPDNRRPVDFEMLQVKLEEISTEWKNNPAATLHDLYASATDGRIKLLLTWVLLNERKSDPELFQYGEYIPLKITGRFESNLFGFARRNRDKWIMCILPLNTAGLPSQKATEHNTSIKWDNTRVIMPEGAPRDWHNILDGRSMRMADHVNAVELFRKFPVVVAKARMEKSSRKAGVLLHISSLPGNYGTGDFGREAYRFADMLSSTYQSYWQTLPLSPVTRSQSWSPYSSPSAFAGNTLLVSPRYLCKDGLITSSDLDHVRFAGKNRVDNENAGKFRDILLEKAWKNLKKDTSHFLYQQFKNFCKKESYWLDDYTLFIAYKDHYGGKDWSRWPENVKSRDQKTLKTASYEFSELIRLEKFKQFIFDRQWKKLKNYANNKGIEIFGDIPFYVSYDSADVWANQHLFNLNARGKMNSVAGVPPDYFDKNGQLWNMPVYNWSRMKESGYDWWIRRLARNLELFDLLRLDHFRAFSAYWEVPSGEKTAVNGAWKSGPGSDLFVKLQEKFPEMPFVAEDLGDIDQKVYDLKDQFGLPGMQVLQFSFNEEMASNLHTPHNHSVNSLVYTGTHDNNTIRGWYEKELDRAGKARIHEYAGKKVKTSEIPVELIRMAFASPARIAVIPMQDYLKLGREARMNTPSTSKGNWLWKLENRGMEKSIEDTIRKLTVMYNRK